MQQRLAARREHGELRDGLGKVALHGPLCGLPVGRAHWSGVLLPWVLQVQQEAVHQEREESVTAEEELLIEVRDAEVQDRLAVVLFHRPEIRRLSTVSRCLHDLLHILLLEGEAAATVVISAPDLGCYPGRLD